MFPTFVWRGEVAAHVRDPLNAGIVGALDEMRGGAARISVSFNIMLASYAERMSKPLWQPRQA